MKKVKNHSDLRKDPRTGAVINVNRKDIERAKRIKEKMREKEEKILSLEARLERLEKILGDM